MSSVFKQVYREVLLNVGLLKHIQESMTCDPLLVWKYEQKVVVYGQMKLLTVPIGH